MDAPSPKIGSLGPAELKSQLSAGGPLVLLDVREPVERAFCAIPAPSGVRDLHVPMGAIPASLDAIRSAASAAGGPLVVYCHHGVRSLMAGRWLAAQGLEGICNLEGGIDAYSLQADPDVPRY
jgi:rhodanese-related sulfurtransferase